MKETPSERRMAENEMVFRKRNEKIEKGFDEIKRIAQEDDQEHMITADDAPLLFYCECSDENCQKRIHLKPSLYSKLHSKNNRFTIIEGHEDAAIEKVVWKEEGVCVVEKYMEPPASATKLKPTPVDNT